MKRVFAFMLLVVFLAGCKTNNATTDGTTQTEPAITGAPQPADATPVQSSTPIPVANGYYKQLKGKIGAQEVQMNLVKTGNKLYGNYNYLKIGELIDLTAPENSANIDENGNFTLAEFTATKNEGYAQTGTLKGQIKPDGTVTGAWSSPDATKIFNFTLNAVPLSNSAELQMVNINKQEGNCQTEEPCAHIEIIYPVLAKLPGGNGQALNSINNTIAKALAESMPTEEPTPPQQAAEQFITDFKEQDASYKMSWEHEVMTNIYHNSNNLLSLGFSTYTFTGGAHPNHAEAFYNFNLLTGKEIELTDIFSSGYEKRLTSLAEQKLRKLYAIGAKTPLTEAGFFEEKFALNDNFSVSKTAIAFLFNPYEIAPYAMGEQLISIPWTEVKDMLKPGGVVNW
ncbi:DUF3298/DUF4163 domain-containing protein [Sphingobacteriales bacterium UPWRP_1]|nr:hypothetical protein BVG80_18245 [Sphingobacteriales bacterium TSM_CSM]PSJ73584.1 DUF3298/DUF4163 domain-containing protein [Sphingobacteriales bacterium UPWRP_1]